MTANIATRVAAAANKALSLLGKDSVGDPLAWLHWQNLSDDGPPHGRAWLHVKNRAVSLEWSIRKEPEVGLSLRLCLANWERVASISHHLGFLSLYFGLEGRPPKALEDLWKKEYGYDSRELSVRGALFTDKIEPNIRWNLWSDPDCWESHRPKWRDGSWYPLGMVSYEHRDIAKDVPVEIPMPEGVYAGKMSLQRAQAVRGKKKIPIGKPFNTIDAAFPYGIPHDGKGEALYGLSCPADSIPAGIGKVVAHVMRDRLTRKGKPHGTVYPPPAERHAAHEEAKRLYEASRRDPSIRECEEVR